jgi:uncharacterized membrane protein YhhN
MSPALWVSLLASAIYTATIPPGQFPGRWAVKAAAVGALAVMARRHPLLAFGLALGALGDLLLDLSPSLFVWGLAAFLCGHIVYTVCFLRTGGDRVSRAALAALAGYAVLFGWWLWPSLGELRLPVMFYIAAITAMAMSSWRVSRLVAAGALLFLISDSLLAANRFKTPLPARDYLVWLTYYAGQLAIAWGMLGRYADAIGLSRSR